MFWSPRIGKSFGTILSIQNSGFAQTKIVVVAPYGVCGQWARLLEAYGLRVTRLYEHPNMKAVELLNGAHVVVVNYQRMPQQAATWGGKPMSLADVLKSWGPDMLVIDESHYIVAPGGSWANAVRHLAWHTPWVRCLSGTPAPNHYGNLWGQMAALNPDAFGWSYKQYADRWLILDNLYKSRVLAYRNLDEELKPLLNQFCSFVRRDDVFGPDQWIVNVRELELPPKAARLYAKLAREWLIDDEDENLKVDGLHILKRLVRLQQLASGYIVDDEENVERELHTTLIDAVLTDLDEIIATGEKAIVFHRFTWEATQLAKRIKNCRLFILNGATPSHEREIMQQAIENDEGPIVGIVQTQAGGIGVSYAKSAYALIMSQSFSFVQEQQARDRIYAIQNGVVVPRHLMYYRALGTVHEFIAEALEIKLDMHDQLTRINRSDMAFGSKSGRHKLKIDNAPALGV